MQFNNLFQVGGII